jgi:PAS domain S-box-containing protein
MPQNQRPSPIAVLPIEAENALRESETRFRELADNISQFAWTADAKGWIYWYNKRWHDYAGTTLEGMQGWGWQKVHHPEHVDRVVQRIRQSFEDGTPWEDTFPLRSKDGTYRWFLSRALPIRNEAGEIIRWFGTNTDVTEQIEAENALREINATLEQRVEAETQERLHIWNVSQDLLVVADVEGKYLSVNPAWTATLGWSEADLVGRSSQWLLHPDDQEKTRAEIRHLAAGRNTVRFETRFRHGDGSYRWISWKAVPEGGRHYAMGRDITELKDAENELREARRELALVSRRATLAAMLAAIAHEIKQPLAAIVSNASAGSRFLSKTPPIVDDACIAFKAIAADAFRADEIIQSVRAMFSQSDEMLTPLDVNELIRQTIRLVRGELETARIAIQLELASQLHIISAHRGQLQQVVLSLVTNAVDAMRTITERSRVLKVKSEAVEMDHIAISVEDSGTGIDPKNMDQIFDAFFTTKSNGMGMGLAVCQSIVEAHGGTLSASTGVPYGSVFRIALPINR